MLPQADNKKFLILLILAVTGVLLLFLFTLNKFGLKTKTIYVNNTPVKVEIADSSSLREKGLSARDHLPQDSGMLFVYPKASIYAFWMRDMKFPLDFIWIKESAIVDITENVPIPQTNNLFELPGYTSDFPVDKVLEVNSGFVKEHEIKIGDIVKL